MMAEQTVSLTYLGTAGWHLEFSGAHLLIDPYFSRLSLWQVLTLRLTPDLSSIQQHCPPADWVFVSHPHHDHIMDVPGILRLTSARVYASPQADQLLDLFSVPADVRHVITAGDTVHCGSFTVEVYASHHREFFGKIPAHAPLNPARKPPLRALGYRIQQVFSFCITVSGKRLLFAGGVDNEPAVQTDVLCVGADADQAQLSRILDRTKPDIIFPNHWDNMFRKLSDPPRAMIIPSQGLRSKRIDLTAWEHTVHEILPSARVIIPEYFEPVQL